MAGLSDIHHDLCLGLALWNGADPILKERMFGLTGPQGNHGEDVKDYWWYLDALPSHAWLRWRYHYPQAAFPYQRLVEENARRSRDEPEFELLDTGVFDENRYWSVDVAYAKASPTEVLARITIENHGPEEATLSVLPTLWFRNTWRVTGDAAAVAVPGRRRHRGRSPAAVRVPAGRRPGRGRRRAARRCSATTRRTPRGCSGRPRVTAYPKDGINDHVVSGATTVNPDQRRHQGRLVVPADGAGRGHGGGAAAAAPAGSRRSAGPRTAGRWSRRRPSTRSMAAPGAGGRRVLRRHRAGRHRRRTDAGAAAGLRRAGLEQADVPVPGEPVAGRRPRPAGTAGRAPDRPQRRLAAPGLLRRAGHARPVGVPVVRRLGPGVPHDPLGAPGPGVRQVPAAGAAAGVVPAPERGAAGVRVELRRRQPAGARPGRAPGVRHRRRHRPSTSWSGCSRSCC